MMLSSLKALMQQYLWFCGMSVIEIRETSLAKRKRSVDVVEIGPQGSNNYSGTLKVEDLFQRLKSEINSIAASSVQQSIVKALTIEDLYHCAFESNFTEPLLLVRQHAVVLKLYPVFAVVLADKMYLVFARRTKVVNQLIKEISNGVIEQWEESKQQSIKRRVNNFNEHRFYSALFTTVVALHDHQAVSLFKRVTTPDNVSVKQSNLSLDNEPQNAIKAMKQDISSLAKSIAAYKKSLDVFLEKEEQLCLLNLTALKSNPHLYNKPLNDDIAKYIDDSLNTVETCKSGFNLLQLNVSKIGVLLKRKLDEANSKLRAQEYNYIARRLSIRTMTIMFTISTVWFSAYAMNLDNGIDSYGSYFYAIFVCVTTALMIVCLNLIFNYFTQYYFDIKVKMAPKKKRV